MWMISHCNPSYPIETACSRAAYLDRRHPDAVNSADVIAVPISGTGWNSGKME
jgi:hypothetical protein